MLASSPRLLLLFLVAILVAPGCAGLRPARKKIDGDMVQSVRFDGATYGQQELLRAQMGQKASSLGVRTPLLNRVARGVALDERLLSEDTYRIETWLAHQGWFDARLVGWRVERLRPQRLRSDGTVRKAGVVVVRGVLDRGELSTVRSFDVQWADNQSPRATQANLRRSIERDGYGIKPGLPFNLDYVEYSRALMLATVRDTGHAYADVDMVIDAYPEERVVDITFVATSGPVTRVGPVRIYGNEDVRTEDIRQVMELEEGAATRQHDLAAAHQRLINLGVFKVVRMDPDLSQSDVTDVPIDVSVTEAQFGTVRGGGGVVYDGTAITPRVSAELTHRNIDGRLARLEASADIGAGIPLVGGFASSRLVGGAKLGIARPRAFGRRWDTNAQLSFRRDLFASQLIYARARALWGVSWRVTDDVVISAGPSVEFGRLGSGSLFSSKAELSADDELIAAATFGTTAKNPYLLTLLEGRLTADWRDEAVRGQDPSLDAKGGYYYNVAVRQAVPLSLGGLGEFQFTDLLGEARFYRSPLGAEGADAPLTLALRLKGKWLPSLRQSELRQSVPYADRAFLGGTSDMRGFRLRNVGAYDCICLVQEEPIRSGILPVWPFARDTGVTRLEPNPTFVPRGGRFSMLVSGEVRRRWPSGNTGALFADAGVLGSTLEELRRLDRTLRWDVGVGYRRATPVGPIRIDLAFRPAYGEDLGPLREDSTFDNPSIGDDAYFRGTTYGCDPFQDSQLPRRVPGLLISDQLGRQLPPVVLNLSIAIGEAL